MSREPMITPKEWEKALMEAMEEERRDTAKRNKRGIVVVVLLLSWIGIAVYLVGRFG